jgi:hypothetical protein
VFALDQRRQQQLEGHLLRHLRIVLREGPIDVEVILVIHRNGTCEPIGAVQNDPARFDFGMVQIEFQLVRRQEDSHAPGPEFLVGHYFVRISRRHRR